MAATQPGILRPPLIQVVPGTPPPPPPIPPPPPPVVPVLIAFTLSVGSIEGGGSLTGTVLIDTPAPAGGDLIGLASDTPVVSLPDGILILEGDTEATFAIATAAVDQAIVATLSATDGVVTLTVPLTVQPLPPPPPPPPGGVDLSALSIAPSTVVGGTGAQGTVTLDGPAPTGGFVVSLVSSAPSVAAVPASVTVPVNLTTATFPITTTDPAVDTTVTVTASTAAQSRTALLTVTHVVPPPPPPPPGASHDYYNFLLTLPQLHANYSCRDNAQLFQYGQSHTLPQNITYDPVNDPDPRKQDAAKVLVPADDTTINNQVRFPINQTAGHSYLVTWDYWMGREWAFSNTSMGNSKHFNIGKPSDASYLLTQSTYYKAIAGTLALFTIRGASPDYADATIWPPPGQEHYVYAERWSRAWYHITPNVDGTYHANVWFADTVQDPVQAYTDVRFTYPPAGEAIGKFWLEYATSQNIRDIPPGRGTLTSYVRNVVILEDFPLGSVPGILQKPV